MDASRRFKRLRVDDLRRQAEFWTAAPDYVAREGDTEDFVLLHPRDGAGPNVSLDRVSSTVQVLDASQ